jgi:hypothetical protein
VCNCVLTPPAVKHRNLLRRTELDSANLVLQERNADDAESHLDLVHASMQHALLQYNRQHELCSTQACASPSAPVVLLHATCSTPHTSAKSYCDNAIPSPFAPSNSRPLQPPRCRLHIRVRGCTCACVCVPAPPGGLVHRADGVDGQPRRRNAVVERKAVPVRNVERRIAAQGNGSRRQRYSW